MYNSLKIFLKNFKLKLLKSALPKVGTSQEIHQKRVRKRFLSGKYLSPKQKPTPRKRRVPRQSSLAI